VGGGGRLQGKGDWLGGTIGRGGKPRAVVGNGLNYNKGGRRGVCNGRIRDEGSGRQESRKERGWGSMGQNTHLRKKKP